jgi:hypothetical protein
MSDPDVVDLVVNDPKTGKLLLVIVEGRPWNGEPMFNEFMEKIGTYVDYVQGDQFRAEHPGRKATDVVIKLDCAHQPDSDMQACFAEMPAQLQEFGIGFVCEVLGAAPASAEPAKGSKEPKEPKELKEPKPAKEPKAAKEPKSAKAPKPPKGTKAGKSAKPWWMFW